VKRARPACTALYIIHCASALTRQVPVDAGREEVSTIGLALCY
jgi:hypothetical protein